MNDVVALDAATGRAFWVYRYTPAPDRIVCCGENNRGLAILGNTLFMATLDAKLIAIDVKSGRTIWQTGWPTRGRDSMTLAPLVVKDKVIIGVGGGEYGIRGFMPPRRGHRQGGVALLHGSGARRTRLGDLGAMPSRHEKLLRSRGVEARRRVHLDDRLVRPAADRYPSGRDLIVSRAPQGTKAKGAHDMHREYVIQSALAPVFDYVAPMVAFCDDAEVVGGDFYAMDRIAGVIPRSEWPADVPLSPDQARALCLDAVDVLAELHGIDPGAAGLTDLGKGTGYVQRQVKGWSARYRNARTNDVPDLECVMAWLDATSPTTSRPA